MSEPRENWRPEEHTVRNVLTLQGAVVIARDMAGGAYADFRVDRMSVSTWWRSGQEELARTSVLLTGYFKLASGRWSTRERTISYRDVRGAPAWLEDIIIRATPRNVG